LALVAATLAMVVGTLESAAVATVAPRTDSPCQMQAKELMVTAVMQAKESLVSAAMQAKELLEIAVMQAKESSAKQAVMGPGVVLE
jgi:hypothetical protein